MKEDMKSSKSRLSDFTEEEESQLFVLLVG